MTLQDEITTIEQLDNQDLRHALVLLYVNSGSWKPEYEADFEAKRQRVLAELTRRGMKVS